MNKPMNLTDSQFRCVMNTARSVAAQVAREEARRYLPEGVTKLEAQNQELVRQTDALTSQVQQLQDSAQTLDDVLGIRTAENHKLRQKLESAVAQNVALREELLVCREQRAVERGELNALRTQVGRMVTENRKNCEPRKTFHSNIAPNLNDGDRLIGPGGEMIWFRGQWRRPSEMEGFASAKKYL